MRKLTLLLVFMLLSAVTQAQKSTLFKFKYLPKQTYGITTKTGVDVFLTMQDLRANLEENTDTSARTVNFSITNEAVASIKTNAVTANSFPVTILGHNFSSKVILNGEEAPQPATNPVPGMVVNGKIDTEGKLSVDTAGATINVKSGLSIIIGGMPQQFKFPDKQMKVGDTFKQEANLSGLDLPDFGIDKSYPITVTYKLMAVKDGLAYFDTTSESNLNISKEAQGRTIIITGKGNGSGKMVFNIVKGYPQSAVNKIDCVLDFDVPNSKVAVKLSLNTDAQYVVN